MGPVMVVVVDLGTEFESSLFDVLEAVAPTELFFQVFIKRSHKPFCCGVYGVMYSCLSL
jgi:hypothetical protein